MIPKIRAIILCLVTVFGVSSFADTHIVIENMQFSPAEQILKVGETITWENKDLVPHTITALDGKFDSQVIAPGKSWQYKVTHKGRFPYKCNLHPTMFGTLTVQ